MTSPDPTKPRPSVLPTSQVRSLIYTANELGRCIDNIWGLAGATPSTRLDTNHTLGLLLAEWTRYRDYITALWPSPNLDGYLIAPEYTSQQTPMPAPSPAEDLPF
jgi:hypothetical protein